MALNQMRESEAWRAGSKSPKYKVKFSFEKSIMVIPLK